MTTDPQDWPTDTVRVRERYTLRGGGFYVVQAWLPYEGWLDLENAKYKTERGARHRARSERKARGCG